MFYRFRVVTLLCWVLGVAAILGFAGACGPEQYKADADEEVYKIINSKWQDSFGQKANYIISDSNTVSSPNDIQIEKGVPPSGVISLSQAVAIATSNNRNYQLQKESLYLSALGLTLTRYQYARQWFGTVDGSYVDDKSNGDDVSLNTSGGVSQTQLFLDGVIVNAGIAIDWVRFLTGDPRTTLGSVLSGDVTVPLLGAGAGKVARENLTQAERTVLYRIRLFNRYRKTFVVSIVYDYYGVLQRRDEVTNAKNYYEMQVESKERLEMYAEAGRVDRFDVDEAEQSMLSAENSWVAAQQRYEQALDQFKIRLSLSTDADIKLAPDELEALRKVGISEPNYILEAAIETALVQRLDLANSRDQVKDTERKVVLAAEGLGVQLNLTGGYNVSSAEKTKIERLQFQKGIYDLGFNADLPFNRKAERNAYREALIALEQRQREHENDVDDVKLNVRQSYRQLREQAESYRIQKMSLELAETRVESNELLLDAGRIPVRLLLESQSALLRAQNSFTSALVSHTVAKLGFFRDIGILQVKPDGMWKEQIQ